MSAFGSQQIEKPENPAVPELARGVQCSVGVTRDELQARTATFARSVTSLCKPLLQSLATRSPSSQLMRAATSIAANYRAAGLGRSRAEFIAKLGVVREEADECVYWLEHLQDTAMPDDQSLQATLKEAKELSWI